MIPLPRVPISQARLFQKLRWRMFRNARVLLFNYSRVRLLTMIACSAVVAVGLFICAYVGFSYLGSETKLPPTGGIIGLVFDAMFFVFGGMLVFSTGLILYASLFTGAEARYLLTTPARADQIFSTKFQGAVGFSSWAFLVLGAPILIAYGTVFHVPWHFYLMLPVWLLGYVLLPGSAGAIFSILFVNFFPRRRKQALFMLIGLLALGVIWWLYRAFSFARIRQYNQDREALEKFFDMFALATGHLSPSQWISSGLLSQARGDFTGALLPLCLLWSHALVAYLLAAFLAKKFYRRGFNRMSAEGGGRKVYGSHWLDEIMDILVGYLDPKTRKLIVKDFRTFRREPAQVGQLGLFAGLMLLCVINIRQFFGADLPVVNQSVVSLLNFSAAGLLMCAFLGRFVYPLISLEGRKFWILGLLPIGREQLLWGKFAFAATLSYVLAGGIILISDLVLDMPGVGIGLHQLAMATLALGLSGLSVGLSAWMPNFRETDPSKIVVGFGGLIFTLASLFYLVLAVILMLVPYHVLVARDSIFQSAGELPWWAFAGVPVGLIMAAAAIRFPMSMGAKTLRAMEF